MRVALMTCLLPPDTDPDEALLRDGLRAAGVDAHVHAWDDPAFHPNQFDLVVLRSTWNYYKTPDRFLSWCDDVACKSRLLNPADIVRVNAHKNYLKSFEARGLPIVPTEWVERGTAPDLGAILTARGWNDVVVKPAISAGSWRTKRFQSDQADEGTAFLAEIAADGDAMVQGFIPSVDRGGERSIMWIGGEVTHVIVKHPRYAGQHENVGEANRPSQREREMVRIALA